VQHHGQAVACGWINGGNVGIAAAGAWLLQLVSSIDFLLIDMEEQVVRPHLNPATVCSGSAQKLKALLLGSLQRRERFNTMVLKANEVKGTN
jgi:hypothetical protein